MYYFSRAGYYCDQEGLSDVAGPCSQGYYCPAGQSTHSPGSFICPEAYYCTEGSPAPLPCDSGYYQNQQGQWNCTICPAVSMHG